MGVAKKELLGMLNSAIELEEWAIPIYSRHLKTALFWSGLDAVEREGMRIQLSVLSQEAHRHTKVLSRMKKKIEEDKRHVF